MTETPILSAQSVGGWCGKRGFMGVYEWS